MTADKPPITSAPDLAAADENLRELNELHRAINAATHNDGSESDVEAIERLGRDYVRAIDSDIDRGEERDEARAERDLLWDATGIAHNRPVEFVADAIERMVDTARIARVQLRPQLARAEAAAKQAERQRDEARAALALVAKELDGAEPRADMMPNGYPDLAIGVQQLKRERDQARADLEAIQRNGADLIEALSRAERERDQFRESALMYAAEVAELRTALPRDEEGNRQYGRLMPGGRVIPSSTPDPTHYRINGPWQPMSQPEGADAPELLITTGPELAAAYGITWPAGACTCCGAQIYDGRCYSWDNPEISNRPENCTCPTGGEPR